MILEGVNFIGNVEATDLDEFQKNKMEWLLNSNYNYETKRSYYSVLDSRVHALEVAFNKDPNEFLLTHDFGEDFKELNEVPIDQIFTFKNIWNSLSDENKNILINYIKGLNKLAHKYIDSD